MCVHSDEFWLLPFSWRSLTQSLCLWVEVFIWRGNNELGGKAKGRGRGQQGCLVRCSCSLYDYFRSTFRGISCKRTLQEANSRCSSKAKARLTARAAKENERLG